MGRSARSQTCQHRPTVWHAAQAKVKERLHRKERKLAKQRPRRSLAWVSNQAGVCMKCEQRRASAWQLDHP